MHRDLYAEVTDRVLENAELDGDQPAPAVTARVAAAAFIPQPAAPTAQLALL